MTTFRFQPTVTGPFQFQPTLDKDQYQAIVAWNFAGARYYVSIFTLQGVRVLTLPLIGSLDGIALATMTWDHGFVNVTTLTRHGYIVGDTMDLVVAGCLPVGYNGTVRALITGLDTFQFPLSIDPGDVSQLGLVNYDINIVAGYFSSKMVFRESGQVFEVTP